MKLTVLMGGTSAERDVSLASGARIVAALRSRGHAVTAVDPAAGVMTDAEVARVGVGAAPPSIEELASLHRGMGTKWLELPEVRGAEVVFLALHGGQGEDGTVQAMLDAAGVRYTGSGHLASALAMDKDLSKILFRHAGVGTADWVMAPRGLESDSSAILAGSGDFALGVRDLGLPVIVKPSKQGSTVGLTVVKAADQMSDALALAFKYDDEVMVEAFVPGRELTVGILGGEALPVIEIKAKKEIYDYECKYTKGMAEEFPAQLPDPLNERIQDQARRAFAALKLGGYARIDFRMTDDGAFYCLEANTLPGMTETSLIPQAAAAAGIDFPDLCERIAMLAVPASS